MNKYLYQIFFFPIYDLEDLSTTVSADSNECISDEHFFMIKWNSNQKKFVFGILRMGDFSCSPDHISYVSEKFSEFSVLFMLQ